MVTAVGVKRSCLAMEFGGISEAIDAASMEPALPRIMSQKSTRRSVGARRAEISEAMSVQKAPVANTLSRTS
jgi:hypothetical protein